MGWREERRKLSMARALWGVQCLLCFDQSPGANAIKEQGGDVQGMVMVKVDDTWYP